MYTVPSHYIRTLAKRIEDSGHDIESILKALHLSPEVVREPLGMVLAEQYVALIKRGWDLVQDEYLGQTHYRCKPGHFALMVRYVYQFDTLSPLLTELCRYYNTTREDVRVSIELHGAKLYLYLDLTHPELDRDHFLCEFMLATFHRFFCWITGKRIQLDSATFDYAKPAHAYAYDDLFPCRHEFEQPRCTLIFAKDYLSLPLVRNWLEVSELLRHAPADLMTLPGNDDRLSTCIKAMLLERYRQEGRFRDLNEIAVELKVSPQTLRRKLQLEGISYQQIKDLIRRDIAIDKLTQERLRVAEVGELLGFAEPSSFTRAFKQWTGVSPAEYRIRG